MFPYLITDVSAQILTGDNYKTAGQNSGQFQNSCFVNSVTKVKKSWLDTILKQVINIVQSIC